MAGRAVIHPNGLQHWHLFFTFFCPQMTVSIKWAGTDRAIHPFRYSRHLRNTSIRLSGKCVSAGEQQPGVGVPRIGHNSRCTAFLYNAPAIHHQNPIAHSGNQCQIMRNEQVSQFLFLLQILQQMNDLRLNRNIQR